MQWLQALKEDYVNFNKHETNEEAVLRCHYFSCYKGRLVIRKGGKRSASLGALFMTKHADADTLRHEYGHVAQLKYLGLGKYLLCIGLPSQQMWGSLPYYEKPWEITADYYGGVQNRTHSKEAMNRGFAYLRKSKRIGAKIWKTIE